MTGAYHAAKFGIEAVGDVFRRELRGWGISVSIVEPGSIATEIWDRGEAAADEIAGALAAARSALRRGDRALSGRPSKASAGRGIPPDRAARAIEHALTARRPSARYLIGTDAKVQARARHLIPTRLFDRIVARATGV